MPRIDEIIDTLAEAKFLSTLDLNKGFHQVPLRSQDKPKTAFCTSWGKFQYTRMPFGPRGAPATFQRLMDEALDDHLDQGSGTYGSRARCGSFDDCIWLSQIKLEFEKL